MSNFDDLEISPQSMSAEIEQLDVIADLASKKFVGSGANGGVQTITRNIILYRTRFRCHYILFATPKCVRIISFPTLRTMTPLTRHPSQNEDLFPLPLAVLEPLNH